MAISPPSRRGNDSTSVGLFFLRKRRLSCCRRLFPAIRTSTSPPTPASFCALRTNRASPRRLTLSTTFSKMITCSESKWGGPDRPPRDILLFLLLQRWFRRLFACAGRLGQLQRHLLIARALVVGAHDPLHQVVAHDILFPKEVEGEPLDVLEHSHGFQQPALARVGQVDLGDVARDHRLGVEPHAGYKHLHLFR